MASELLQKLGGAQTLTITMSSIANAAGQISTVVDNTVTRAPMGFLAVKVRTGGSAPSANYPYKFYLIRRSNAGVDLADSGLGLVNAAVSTEPANADLVGVYNVPASTAFDCIRVFVLYDLPAKFSIVFWNGAGQTTDTTAGNHVMQFIPVTLEAQ